uniref:Uncharacterized protein n=1 Tax=viral metagenome TaxID=1070528 RepID=A0A6C0E712_9ZZZZ
MKYQSFNKHKYNKHKRTNKTIKHNRCYQIGGNESSLVSVINKSPDSQIIGPKDNKYPSSYLGYNVFVPPGSKSFTLEQLVKDALEEGNFLNVDKTIDLSKLNEQLMNDSFRMDLVINNTKVFNYFKDKITNPNESNNPFNEELSQLQPITEIDIFTKKLLEIFPKLNVKENEIKCIQEFANKNNWTILPNYWAYLPFYDEIINENGITNETKLNDIKVLSQQNISKTMMDILMKFVSLPSIFHETLQLGGSFKTFGSKMNDYISQIPTAPFINIDINNANVIIQNKLYFSLVNVSNEFGLAVISTCIYTDFQKNEVFMIWKIERWRNSIIKRYYHFIIDVSNKGTPVSEELLELMQTYIYNNQISDNYPKTHKELLDYFVNNTNKEAINNINATIKEQLNKNESDTNIAKIIKDKSSSMKQMVPLEDPSMKKENEEPNNEEKEPATQDSDDKTDETMGDKIDETTNKDNVTEENTNNLEDISHDEEKIHNDELQIGEARENVNNAIEQYNRDQQQLRDDQPEPSDTDKLTNTLATLGSVTALGAIGSGLYFAAPLLVLGGSKKNKRKYAKKSKKTRRK